MNHVQQMLATHPRQSGTDPSALAECIQECFACAQACTSCADACLGEQAHVEHLVRCIRLNLDCADVCDATGRVLSRQTEADPGVIRAQLQSCAVACKACGDECARHAEGMGMEHCRVCAEACRRCEEACTRLLRAA
ncbi:four-helix bundle copper-binding protein [Longimicrobium sp.]|uniref:four-helix bundle copper-binding protein n=1 Tax=Longimicrobium sp. TaxID=2029185 RepID=UPI002E31C304|nr:four-helix bundle copper-binding protein [Longimicrobium sp.]HEX6041624.1 four-helix bundle copper-binding protein [Longimicrobium sp.]